MSKAEMETVVRWDMEEKVAHLWTAQPAMARLWEKRGYNVRKEHGSWWAAIPKSYITFRTLPLPLDSLEGVVDSDVGRPERA